MKGEHYDTLVTNNNPLVSGEQKNISKKQEEKEVVKIDDEEDETDKDKIIKKLKAELKSMKEGMEVLKTLYDGCEKQVKQLQEDKEK